MYSNILVHIPSERSGQPVIDLAIALAVAHRSHLDAVAIGFESMGSIGMVAEGGSAAVAIVMEAEQKQALERANAAVSVFEVEARLAKVSYGVRTIAAIPSDAEPTIGELARLYDLTVMLQPDPFTAVFDGMMAQAVLFNSGGPVLMVPYTHKAALDARHVGIAWDGSRPAARALHDAMPFLTAAESVTVIAVNEEAGEASSDQVANHLARRGIKAQVEQLTAEHGKVQGSILSAAAESGIGLLVMGGYGHSRLKERILGGVTRSMFESMTVPVLMSH